MASDKKDTDLVSQSISVTALPDTRWQAEISNESDNIELIDVFSQLRTARATSVVVKRF